MSPDSTDKSLKVTQAVSKMLDRMISPRSPASRTSLTAHSGETSSPLTNREHPDPAQFFHQGGGRHQPHLWASSPTSRSFYFEGNEVALEGVGRCFWMLAEEKCKGAELFLKARKQWGGRALVGPAGDGPGGVEHRPGSHGGPHGPEKSAKQAPSRIYTSWVLRTQTPSSPSSWSTTSWRRSSSRSSSRWAST